MCSKKSSKSLLVVFLILFVSLPSLSALAFLPEYSGASGKESTGLMSILHSMTSPQLDESLTESENFDKIVGDRVVNEDGMVCFTPKQVALMDKSLASAEKKIEDEINPLHWGLLGTISYKYPNILAPGIETYIRHEDLVVSFGIEYDTSCVEGFDQFKNPSWENVHGRVGVGFEL